MRLRKVRLNFQFGCEMPDRFIQTPLAGVMFPQTLVGDPCLRIFLKGVIPEAFHTPEGSLMRPRCDRESEHERRGDSDNSRTARRESRARDVNTGCCNKSYNCGHRLVLPMVGHKGVPHVED